mgnify:CR=1 FL=1
MITKRMNMPKEIRIERKTHKFVTTPRGSRSGVKIPLLTLLRDILKYCDTAAEAKKVIRVRKILIDQKVYTDWKFGLGIMDTIFIPSLNKAWRILPKPYPTAVEIPQNEAGLKIGKVIRKQCVRGGSIQITLHDGRNILLPKDTQIKPYDSVLIKLPSQEIVEHLPFATGFLALISKGKNTGQIAMIKNIERGLKKRLILTSNKKDFEAPYDGVIVVGKEKPVISLY